MSQRTLNRLVTVVAGCVALVVGLAAATETTLVIDWGKVAGVLVTSGAVLAAIKIFFGGSIEKWLVKTIVQNNTPEIHRCLIQYIKKNPGEFDALRAEWMVRQPDVFRTAVERALHDRFRVGDTKLEEFDDLVQQVAVNHDRLEALDAVTKAQGVALKGMPELTLNFSNLNVTLTNVNKTLERIDEDVSTNREMMAEVIGFLRGKGWDGVTERRKEERRR